ncbi:MAG: Stk1 family PASTA domain-containing Ser/Thr kinase [Actinomyces sp.]|jgi:serine/threonine-protein kinase|nr:Stk1 family PASTA domain-containing Ser/Thr kinase [Actinomyces sp.]MCI1788922.1 Stk1 family PASTA domain-containing Ser/Thr kinase [Actinomyces sp.]
MDSSMDHRLGGRYEVRSLIGRGGMAEVHLGFDARLSRIVAIKMLRQDLARDSVFQARFRREAQAAASLNHPNIVAVYDTGEEVVTGADGRGVSVPYIVMEYVEGHTVKDLLSDGTPVPINEAVEIVSGVLSALEYSHAAGLVHRDIKPGNIMLTTDGKVKVMDFGIARALTDSQATMTQPNAVVGTAQYLSPEQARGEQVDARSDLYSTGVVLFELLTGRPPFKGDTAVAVAYQHVSATPPTPSSVTPDVPDQLDRVVMKALAKNREDRYSSAAEMRADLIRASRGADVNAPATSVWAAAVGAGAATETMQMAPPPPPPGADTADRTRTYAPAALATAPGGRADAAKEEQAEAARRKKKKRTLIIAIVVAVLAIAAGLGVWALNREPGTATVPADLVSMAPDDARAALEAVELVYAEGDTVPSDDVAEGLVASSEPAPGSQAAIGSTVTVHLSSGPADTTVPTGLVNSSPDSAQAKIEAAGLKWELGDEESSDTVEAGLVSSVSPKEGASIEAGGTVTIRVSTGKAEVQVPDVSGMTQEQAKATLEAQGLKVGNVTTVDDPTRAKDLVVSTDPAAGAAVTKDSEVNLNISSGYVQLPDLAGMTKSDAEKTLSDLGLSVSWTEVPDAAEAGTVLGTEPRAGTVAQGSTVQVTVSSGPSTPSPRPSSPTPTSDSDS